MATRVSENERTNRITFGPKLRGTTDLRVITITLHISDNELSTVGDLRSGSICTAKPTRELLTRFLHVARDETKSTSTSYVSKSPELVD